MTRRVAIAAASAALLRCGGSPKAPAGGEMKRYALRGKVVSLQPANKIATIEHEEIKGWMEAMTMEFPVKDEAEFKKLAVGDRIEATVFADDLTFYIGEIKVTGKAAGRLRGITEFPDFIMDEVLARMATLIE